MAEQLRRDIEYLLALEGTVLLDIDPYHVNEEHGAIVVSCSDGRCFPDIFMHHDKIQRMNCRENSLIHPLPRHGGALVLAPASPLVRTGSTMQEDLYGEMNEAMEWIGIRKIVLSAHYPCGKASVSGIHAAELMGLLFSAKQAVKARLLSCGLIVSCYFHIDYGQNFAQFDKKKRILSYYADRKGWERIRQ